MRWMLVILGIATVTLQVRLWYDADGFRKTVHLSAAVSEQRVLNQQLRERNASLDAEVVNLKQGLEAAEERARTDLGLIGNGETFFQVVRATDNKR